MTSGREDIYLEPNMKDDELKIGGMTCVSCENRIEQKLNRTVGIKKATVSYSTGTAQISYDSDIITLKDIIKVIEKLDYEVIEDNETKINSASNINKIL